MNLIQVARFYHGVLSLLIFLLVGFDFLVAVGVPLRFSFPPNLPDHFRVQGHDFRRSNTRNERYPRGWALAGFLFHRHTILPFVFFDLTLGVARSGDSAYLAEARP